MDKTEKLIMSRLGKRPLILPTGVTVRVEETQQRIEVSGPRGVLRWNYPIGITFALEFGKQKEQVLLVKALADLAKRASSLWGLARARVGWMIDGVVNGFTKQLEIQGVGYRAKVEGGNVVLNIGASSPVSYSVPSGISVIADAKQTLLTISGIDKELVGLVASQLRAIKPPEPYKGKGIRYAGEVVTRKAGKTATATGGGKAAK